MKSVIKNIANYKAFTFMFLLMLIAVFISFTSANAQGRGRSGGRIGDGFFLSHSFGNRGIHSNIYFAPHIGASFTILPYGYATYWIGGFPYYYYNGFWFQYYPEYGYYVVVNKPADADKGTSNYNLKFDQVKLYDGSTVEGVFQSATDTTITLRVGDQNHDININNIVSINFAPAITDSTQKK